MKQKKQGKQGVGGIDSSPDYCTGNDMHCEWHDKEQDTQPGSRNAQFNSDRSQIISRVVNALLKVMLKNREWSN